MTIFCFSKTFFVWNFFLRLQAGILAILVLSGSRSNIFKAILFQTQTLELANVSMILLGRKKMQLTFEAYQLTGQPGLCFKCVSWTPDCFCWRKWWHNWTKEYWTCLFICQVFVNSYLATNVKDWLEVWGCIL